MQVTLPDCILESGVAQPRQEVVQVGVDMEGRGRVVPDHSSSWAARLWWRTCLSVSSLSLREEGLVWASSGVQVPRELLCMSPLGRETA